MHDDTKQLNYANTCASLELPSLFPALRCLPAAFPLSILRSVQSPAAFRPLQKSVATCMSDHNSRFPTKHTNSAADSKYNELEQRYAAVGKATYKGLANYKKTLQAPPSSLSDALVTLKAACTNAPAA